MLKIKQIQTIIFRRKFRIRVNNNMLKFFSYYLIKESDNFINLRKKAAFL